MVYTFDPFSGSRWADLLQRHPSSSVFHSVPWLQAVQQTYGYKPIVYTTSPPSSPLSNGVVLFQIRSWLTGRRMVSVPFSDHCEPLVDDAQDAIEISNEFKTAVDSGNWKHIELRPIAESEIFDGLATSHSYCLHMLDLTRSADQLFRATHKTCIQRAIRRAEREGLVYESGRSVKLLEAFYRLMLQTRRRQHLPPQPITWFRNLITCLQDRLQIRVAFKNGREIAAILTLQHKNVVVYKYGCSDISFQNLGGTHLLFWNTILEAKSAGLTVMDFGRSDYDNPGLIAFKDRWGAKRFGLNYLRWSRKPFANSVRRYSPPLLRQFFAVAPDPVLEATGRLLYRHVG
jgi:CelD/BcsL family acetyltransferase involved in cellulose biosynthesis